MFGSIGQIAQLAGLLRNPEKIKDAMNEVQTRLAAARFTGEAGGGQVHATVDGRGEPVALKIAPGLVQSADHELLEDLVCAALRQAVQRSREGLQSEMGAMAGMLNLPGVSDLLGGPKP